MRLIIGMALLAGISVSIAQETATDAGVNCSFQSNPERFLGLQIREQRAVFDRVMKFGARSSLAAAAAADPAALPRRNFIDDEIFGKLATAGVPSAPLAGDEEIIRRLYLDLTGRVPTPQAVRDFVADNDPGKRDKLIDKLLYSEEFVDKWTMWFGDLVENNATSVNAGNRLIDSRNAFYRFLWSKVLGWEPVRNLAYEIVSATGNTYSDFSPANFWLNNQAPGGPNEDRYDMSLLKVTSSFLGLSHYDCLLCHNGRGHLDQLSLWGKNTTRTQAQQMAAFFSRWTLATYQMPANPTPEQQFFINSRIIGNVQTGTYSINTSYGNRPNRTPIGAIRTLTPVYQSTGAEPKSPWWRTEFAEFMVSDPMFARNFANRLWKAVFNLALAEPVNALDPARLDPANPPEAPWTFQATHPELLERLAQEFRSTDHNLREFLRLLVSSTAYQLSSRYEGEWKLEYVPLFARHYPRRLEGEEVHDAIVQATGVANKYTIQNGPVVQWAMQLPDTSEPRANTGNSLNFMNLFLRGNRDTVTRSQSATILQQLGMMNDSFVMSRIHVGQSAVIAGIARLPNTNAIVEEAYLTFLARKPSDAERAVAANLFSRATTQALKNTATEDLVWALINKMEFLFSY
jgi:hypothetical protein